MASCSLSPAPAIEESMHDHHRAVCILQHALRVRAQHPAMQDGMAALAHHNKTGLNRVCPVKNLLRRMTHDDIRFQLDSLLLGAFADRHKTAFVALAPFIQNGVEFIGEIAEGRSSCGTKVYPLALTITVVSCISIRPEPMRFSSSGRIASVFSRDSMNSIRMGRWSEIRSEE